MTDASAEAAAEPCARLARPPFAPGGPIRRIGDLLKHSVDERTRILGTMTPRECAQLFHDWTLWARPEQAPPPALARPPTTCATS